MLKFEYLTLNIKLKVTSSNQKLWHVFYTFLKKKNTYFQDRISLCNLGWSWTPASCLNLLNSGIKGISHHAWLWILLSMSFHDNILKIILKNIQKENTLNYFSCNLAVASKLFSDMWTFSASLPSASRLNFSFITNCCVRVFQKSIEEALPPTGAFPMTAGHVLALEPLC